MNTNQTAPSRRRPVKVVAVPTRPAARPEAKCPECGFSVDLHMGSQGGGCYVKLTLR